MSHAGFGTSDLFERQGRVERRGHFRNYRPSPRVGSGDLFGERRRGPRREMTACLFRSKEKTLITFFAAAGFEVIGCAPASLTNGGIFLWLTADVRIATLSLNLMPNVKDEPRSGAARLLRQQEA
jgi:hypothetical protein